MIWFKCNDLLLINSSKLWQIPWHSVLNCKFRFYDWIPRFRPRFLHRGNHRALFKTSHVTRRPSLKCLSGIQEQLLSFCMGKHQILQNGSLSLWLNVIFKITNEIGQQLCHKCCFFCSNSIIKSLFLSQDQPVCMCSPERASQSADCFYSNRDF